MCQKVSVPAVLLRDVKRGTKATEANTSIADEASEWLATQSLVAA